MSLCIAGCHRIRRFNVRGARNLPCETVPGKRAPTVKLCESNESYVPLNDGFNWKGGDPNATLSGQAISQLPPGAALQGLRLLCRRLQRRRPSLSPTTTPQRATTSDSTASRKPSQSGERWQAADVAKTCCSPRGRADPSGEEDCREGVNVLRLVSGIGQVGRLGCRLFTVNDRDGLGIDCPLSGPIVNHIPCQTTNNRI